MITLVRVALWLALMAAAAGVGLVVGAFAGPVAGVGAALVVGGLASAAVLLFVVDVDRAPVEVPSEVHEITGLRLDRSDRRVVGL